jgi:predicted Co/Zn/Cd cation transporter (cation efflux family)
MSQKATDASAFMLAAGLATVPPGLIAIGILIASDYADPAVIAMICAAPAAIALPILAIARLLRGAKAVVPDTHNHHYAGPVHQEHRNVSTQTRGIWVRTTNNGS